MSAERCYHCDRSATCCCDFIIGVEAQDGGLIRFSSELFTCDRLLCEKCSTKLPPLFMCGAASQIIVRDTCRDHAGRADDGLVPMTASKADALRRRLHFRTISP